MLIITTLIAVSSCPSVGKLALAVWGYVLAWFVMNDRIKFAAYRIFDPQPFWSADEKSHARTMEQLKRFFS